MPEVIPFATAAHVRCVAMPASELAELATITQATSTIIDVPARAAAAGRIRALLEQLRTQAAVPRGAGEPMLPAAPLATLHRELKTLERHGAVVLAGAVERRYGAGRTEDALILVIAPEGLVPARVVGAEGGPGRLTVLTERDLHLPATCRPVAGNALAAVDLMPPRDPAVETGLTIA